MAGLKLKYVSPKITFSTSTITILGVEAPTNQRLKILGWKISFDGTSNTATPIQVTLCKYTTGGSFTTLSAVKVNTSDGETVQSVGRHTATVEPTIGDVLERVFVHPQTGYDNFLPFGQEYEVKGGEHIGIQLISPAAGADVVCELYVEE